MVAMLTIMIGAYIFTRCVDMIHGAWSGNGNPIGVAIIVALALGTMLIAGFGSFDALMRGVEATNSLNDLSSTLETWK